MSSQLHAHDTVRRIGLEYGRELAAALLLATRRNDADTGMTRRMAQIVVREIAAAVAKLQAAALSDEVVATYERAARDGVGEGLLRNGIAARTERRAA